MGYSGIPNFRTQTSPKTISVPCGEVRAEAVPFVDLQEPTNLTCLVSSAQQQNIEFYFMVIVSYRCVGFLCEQVSGRFEGKLKEERHFGGPP